jgi:hypothetical protein
MNEEEPGILLPSSFVVTLLRTDQQELLHLQVRAVFFVTFLIVINASFLP